MNTILIAPRQHAPAKGRILAIEPDPARAEALRDLIGDYIGAQCALVKDGNDAIRSIEAQTPDLVLTSMLLPPRDAEAVTACLRRLPAAAHVQVITVPYFIDSEEATRHRPSKVLRFIRRRMAIEPPTCAPALVGAQIEAYLNQARSARTQSRPRGQGSFLRVDTFAPDSGSASRSEAAGAVRRRAKVHQLGRPSANDRRRARASTAIQLTNT